MKGGSYHPELSTRIMVYGSSDMSKKQFEDLKEQLQLMTPQQLRALQGEISNKLDHKASNLLTEEELAALSELFS